MTHPHSKQTGQLGSSSDVSSTPAAFSSAPSQSSQADAEQRGAQTTENIKYGQTISENQGSVSDGAANAKGGYGGVPALDDGKEGVSERGDESAKSRREAGYGGGQDMDRSIGA